MVRVDAFDFHSVELPLARSLSLLGAESSVRRGLRLDIRCEGSLASSHILPLNSVHKENLAECISECHRLAGIIVGSFIDLSVIDADHLGLKFLEVRSVLPSVQYAFEHCLLQIAALHNTKLRQLFNPVNTSIAGLWQPTSSNVTFSQDVDQGCRLFKVKIGRASWAEEADLINRNLDMLPEHIRTNIVLRLDANQSVKVQDMVALLNAIDQKIEYIEEPFATWHEYEDFNALSDCPVAVDENLWSLTNVNSNDAQVKVMSENVSKLARVWILKPTRIGGVSDCFRVASRGKAMGKTVILSSSYDSELLIASYGLLIRGLKLAESIHGFGTVFWYDMDNFNGAVKLNSFQAGLDPQRYHALLRSDQFGVGEEEQKPAEVR